MKSDEYFSQIRQVNTEEAALACLKNQCFHFFSVDIDPILLTLAEN